jgi:hypothetical protein
MNQYEISEFPVEVIKELKSYVYRLIDPRNGETFYVGKGKGNRVFQHLKGALAVEEVDEFSDKIQTIREIINAGLNVIHVIHRHGMDESLASEVEAALIDAYPGTTNILGGSGSNDFGPMNAIEIVNKYSAEEINFEHNVLMITINRSITDLSVYDATRFAWRIDKNKAEKADYVLSVEKGIVVGVFKVHEWRLARKNHFPEFSAHTNSRYGFVGEEAEPQIQKKYLRKRIPSDFRKKGAANPIKYNY